MFFRLFTYKRWLDPTGVKNTLHFMKGDIFLFITQTVNVVLKWVWVHNWTNRTGVSKCERPTLVSASAGWLEADGWWPRASDLSLDLWAASTLWDSAERGLSGPPAVRLGQGPWEDSRSGLFSVWVTWSPPSTITMKQTRRKHSRLTLKS